MKKRFEYSLDIKMSLDDKMEFLMILERYAYLIYS